MNLDFPSHIQLPKETRSELVELLNENLAAAIDLFTQVKHAHWNVRGKHFISRHELFDDVAKHLRHHADDLAERLAALGGFAEGTAALAAKNSQLPDYDLEAVTGDEHLNALIHACASYCGAFRKAIDRCAELNDPVTEDIFTTLLGEAEKDLWFLESHLIQGRSGDVQRTGGNGGEQEAESDEESEEPLAAAPRRTGEATAEAEDSGQPHDAPWEEPVPPPH